jgi:XTP/dITP diphosphohydrolase
MPLQKHGHIFRHIDNRYLRMIPGLEVYALDNEPGVRSARYSGPEANYSKNNMLLIHKIKNIAPLERQARFVCCICYKDAQEEKYFTGITEGIILESLRGDGGFGYDPLFYLPELDKTFAELSTDEKNKLSHRGKAIRKLRNYLLKKYKIENKA